MTSTGVQAAVARALARSEGAKAAPAEPPPLVVDEHLDGLRAPYGGARCPRCRVRAPIIWTVTPAGRKLAVNREPTDDGTVVVRTIGLDGPSVEVLGKPPADGLLRYRVHVADCTVPARPPVWRGKR